MAVIGAVATAVVNRIISSPPGNGDASQVATPTSGRPPSGSVVIASVTSNAVPQPGQQHRSSGNFSTEQAPAGTTQFLWRISGVSAVTFDVMEDKPFGLDPVVFDNLTDGSTTEFYSSRSLYVANPRGAGGQSFTVTVYAVTKG